jgi:hypothetical protein
MIDASLQNDAIEFPTTNTKKIHVQCVKDSLMGNVVNFTIYKGDNDSAGKKSDRERIEMKGKEKGTKGSSFIFAWWFKLDPKMKNTYNDFYHIFQIKTGGSSALTEFPLATLSLTKKENFHLQLNYLGRYGDSPKKLLDLADAKGKWIQVFVEAVFKTKKEGGYIRVMLKDDKGKDLTTETKIPHEVNQMTWLMANFLKCELNRERVPIKNCFSLLLQMWWQGANFRPKWGLYRKKSSAYQSADWQLFQNVQIWMKK